MKNMKRIAGVVCLLCGLTAQAQTPAEAVGINTENPLGVLHIDGGATPSEVLDDVIIDADGRLGAGVAIPAAKVDLSATAEGGALRIADGTQGDGKVLVSDANGAGSWTTLSSGIWWYAALNSSARLDYAAGLDPRPFVNYGSGLISSESQGEVSLANGTITVPVAGKYRITFSQHSITNRGNYYWVKTELQVNGSSRWTPSTWGTQMGLGTFPTYAAILNLEANDELRLVFLQAETFSANNGAVSVFMVELLQPTQ
jgi:hypothetical protein